MNSSRPTSKITFVLRGTAAAVLAMSVAGCGNDAALPEGSQVVAKVGKNELTVHQLNFLLQGLPDLPPERVTAVRKEALERLVEQEALVQAANEKKLANDPAVQQQLEAARRQVLAQAYLRTVALGVTAPDPAAVDKFYTENPDLFRKRRVWRFAEIGLPFRPVAWPELEKALLPTRTIAEAAQVMKERGLDLPVAQNVQRPSEDFPLEMLPKLANVKNGEVIIYPRGRGIVIAQLLDSREVPVDEAKARPAIERALLNRARSDAVQAEAKRVRDAAQVAYLGEFAEGAAKKSKTDSKAAAMEAEASRTGAQPAAAAAAAAAATVQSRPLPETPPLSSANEPVTAEDVEAITKGLKGLK